MFKLLLIVVTVILSVSQAEAPAGIAKQKPLITPPLVTPPGLLHFRHSDRSSHQEFARGLNVIDDPSFEDGTPNSFWSEFSTNFGTPLCDGTCGLGGLDPTPFPVFWTWFGGVTAFEVGSVSQAFTISTSPSASLRFSFGSVVHPFLLLSSSHHHAARLCSGASVAYLDVIIDATTIFHSDCTGGASTDQWVPITIDISAFADNAPHTLVFYSETGQNTALTTNFMVDNVEIIFPSMGTE